jgi:hypothetical protein
MYSSPSNSSRPQVGKSGGKPRPRKDSTDSVMIASAMPSVAATITGETTLGRMWRRITRRGVCRSTGGQHIFALLQRQHLAAHDAGGVHPAGHADGEDDQHEGPHLGAQNAGDAVAKQHHHDQQQGQQRQCQEHVGQPHQGPVQPLEIARQHADEGAQEDRDHHRDEADREARPCRPPSSAPAGRGPAGRCPSGTSGWALLATSAPRPPSAFRAARPSARPPRRSPEAPAPPGRTWRPCAS